MNPDQAKLLSVLKPPARLTPEQTAWFLGFQPHDIPILVQTGLLKPLGSPPPNGLKHFAAAVLEELRQDIKWLARASDAIHRHWQQKNAQKRKGTSRAAPSSAQSPNGNILP